MKNRILLAMLFACGTALSACDNSAGHGHDHDHDHGDGHSHGDHDHSHDHGSGDHDHAHTGDGHAHDDDHAHSHDEVELGTFDIGGVAVGAAQSHGGVEAGQEEHLIIKLPEGMGGTATVRAWIGSSDRSASRVGLGEYAASHDDYDIHVEAPDPLPEGAQWWVEIEQPDGTKVTGSFDFIAG